MKKLLILLLAVALLCSCQEAPKPSDDTSAEDTPSSNVTDTSTEDTTSSNVTDSSAEDTPSSEPPDSLPTTDSADDAVQKLTGNRELDLKQFSEDPDDFSWGVGYCGGNTVYVSYMRDGYNKYIRVIDIAKNEVITTIDVPEGYFLYVRGRYIDFEKDINGEDEQTDYKRMMLSPDGSYEWLEGEFDYSVGPVVRFGSHGVYENFGSIYDADTKSPIMERYTEDGDTYGIRTLNYSLMFPLDDDRFVYRIIGYERMPGFGIYDFSTGKATDIPDSSNMMPVGVCDGKILSYEACWDGYGTKAFVTDPESFETVIFKPLENVGEGYIEISSSRDMEYICVRYTSDDPDAQERYVIMKPETGEIVDDYTLDGIYDLPVFTDDYLFFDDPTAAKLCLITDRP